MYVTHDHVEALILADRLAVMDRGRIEQVGSYQEIYEQPRNVFVAGFLNRHVRHPADQPDRRAIPGRRAGTPATCRSASAPRTWRSPGTSGPTASRAVVAETS